MISTKPRTCIQCSVSAFILLIRSFVKLKILTWCPTCTFSLTSLYEECYALCCIHFDRKRAVLKELSLLPVVPALFGFRHTSMYTALSHIDIMHVDDSGLGTDVLNLIIANLTASQITKVNKRLTFLARFCSCPLVRDIGLFDKGFVSSDDKNKLSHYILYVVYDLLEGNVDMQKLILKTLTAFQAFRFVYTPLQERKMFV